MVPNFKSIFTGALVCMAMFLPIFNTQNTMSASAVASEETLWGDVNGDRSVDSSDASLILEQYSKVSTGGSAVYCDTNGNRYIKLPTEYWVSEIAEMQKLTVAELISLNPQLDGVNKIKAHEKLYIYRSEIAPTPTATTTTNATTTKATTTTTTKVTTTVNTSTPTATAIKPTSSTKTGTVVTATVTVKPTTSKTTTVTTASPTTTTVTTKKYPDATLVTQPYFNSENLYELNSPTATSWYLYTNISDAAKADIEKVAVETLNSNDTFHLYYTDIENVYLTAKNSVDYYLKISPEYQNQFRVVGTLNNKFLAGKTYEVLNITPRFFTSDRKYKTMGYPGEKIKIISYIDEPKEYIWTPDRYHCIYNGNEYILHIYPQNLKYFKLCE